MIQEIDSFEILVRRLPPLQWRLRLDLGGIGSATSSRDRSGPGTGGKASYGEEIVLSSRELIEHLAWGSLDAMAWVWDGENWQRLGRAVWARDLWLGSLWLSPWVLQVLQEKNSKVWVLAPAADRNLVCFPSSGGSQNKAELATMAGPFSAKEVLQLIRRNRWDPRQINIWSKVLARWEPIWKIFPKPAWEFILLIRLKQRDPVPPQSTFDSNSSTESEI